MDTETDLLARLRDIHLPPVPTAESDLWALVLIVIVLAAIGMALWAGLIRRPAWKRECMRELERLDGLDPDAAIFKAAALVRRVVLSLSGDPAFRHLHGTAYLERLDGVFGGRFFSEGAGRILGADLYRGVAPTETQRLELIAGLRHVLRKARGRPC
ncbi:MAG: DUF4381 domain-containing protein [Pseudomonadota bacterium]